MAVTYTRNLKLRIDSNLTANAKYNLERIDIQGAAVLVDSTDAVNIRSRTDINIEPESPDVDGSGVGGVVNVGNESHEIAEFNVYTTVFNLSDALGLLDQGTSGTKYLRLKYNSTLNGSVDTTADRSLSVDLDGADRSLVLGGNLSTLGGNLVLNLSGNTSVTLPTTGTLATLAGSETFTNKTIDADLNTISNIRNSSVASDAAIAYSKLNLTGGIVNADVSGSAAITYAKLALSNSIVNSDVNSAAAIEYSKLNLAGSILNSDISNSASIAYSKLNLSSSIVNADISASAAIAGSKINPDFGSQNISTSGQLRLSNGAFYSSFIAGIQSDNLSYTLPTVTPTANQVLRANSSDPLLLEWATVAGSGTVTSVALSAPSFLDVAGSPITSAGTLVLSLADQSANSVFAGPTTGSADVPTFRSLVVADIPSGIDHGGLSGLSDDDHTQYHTDARALTWLSTRSTTDLPEGSNLYFTSERVDDRVAALLIEGAGIDLTYDDTANTLTIASTITQYTDELAQDAVGIILTDSATIDFTYNDGTPSIVADVIPGGVDHDALLNFVTNEHIDHSAVQIATAATSGLSGGGDITTTRNLLVAPDQATAKATPAGADILLIADSAAANALKNITISSLLNVTGGSFAEDWTSGTSKTVTHSLGTRDVIVQLYDNTTFETLYVDSVIRTDTNTVDLTATEAPTGSGWRVLVKKL